MNHLAWEEWNPRLADYWRTWTHPYRHKVIEHVSKHTPLDGTVLEFGCAIGINLFLLKLKRPDIKLIGYDLNDRARNYASLLVEDWDVDIREAPKTSDDIPKADVIYTTFTLAYMQYPHILEYLKAFIIRSNVMVLGEPTLMVEKMAKAEFTGLPCPGWVYPYPYILKEMGRHVDVELIGPQDGKSATVNAITIAKEPSE